MTRDEYFALRRVNFSNLKQARRSAAHYRHAVMHGSEDRGHLKVGRGTHLATMEPEKFEAEVVLWAREFGARRGNAWRDFQAEHAGKLILTEAEYSECVTLAAAVHASPLAMQYLSGGSAEQAALWTDPETGIDCKGLLDYVNPLAITDLKTTKDASIEGFRRECRRYGYHLQGAFYQRGWSLAHGVAPFLPYFIVAVEKSEPHPVVVYRLPDHVLEDGREEIRELLLLVKKCREEKRWPGYAESVVDLELPSWTTPTAGEVADDVSDLGIEFNDGGAESAGEGAEQ